MIGYVISGGGKLTANQDLGLKISTPIGTLVGQLLFGWLADVYGRKRMYGIELMIIIVGTLAQAVSGSGPALTLIGVLVMWRFVMVRAASAALSSARALDSAPSPRSPSNAADNFLRASASAATTRCRRASPPSSPRLASVVA